MKREEALKVLDRDFLEAHYEISSAIEHAIREDKDVVKKAYEDWGYTVRYDMSIAWTTEFQNLHKYTDWGQQDFIESIEAFIKYKLDGK